MTGTNDVYEVLEVTIPTEDLPFHDQISHYPEVQVHALREMGGTGFPSSHWEIAKPPLCTVKVKGVLLQGF